MWSNVDVHGDGGITAASVTEYVCGEEYDSYNTMYGNWPFIAQEAARHGFKSYYSRANNQQPIRDFLAAGCPVELGSYTAARRASAPTPRACRSAGLHDGAPVPMRRCER